VIDLEFLQEHRAAIHSLNRALWRANRFLVRNGERPLKDEPWRWSHPTRSAWR
jgi:hypothetical protein